MAGLNHHTQTAVSAHTAGQSQNTARSCWAAEMPLNKLHSSGTRELCDPCSPLGHKLSTHCNREELMNLCWICFCDFNPHFAAFFIVSSVQFNSVAQSCPTLCPRLPHPSPFPRVCSNCVHQVGDAIQPSHPLSSPSLPAFNLSQHQGLFQWVGSLLEVAKVLEFQLPN